jgi:hypothetical protein
MARKAATIAGIEAGELLNSGEWKTDVEINNGGF